MNINKLEISVIFILKIFHIKKIVYLYSNIKRESIRYKVNE